MAGLYVHIPFCKSRCSYCSFYSTTLSEHRQRYVDALCREMADVAAPPQPLSTIYLGGGTPSQLSAQQLDQLFTHIYNRYSVAPDAEVTIEVNPDDVSPAFAAQLSQLPVGRVSMGAQTFDDRRLRLLNRRHTAAQVPQAVALLRKAGISNVSIDLMYGFPDETLADWQRDVSRALSLGVEHLSAYCLMLEEGTPLYKQVISRYEVRGTRYEDTSSGCEVRGTRYEDALKAEEDEEETERAMYYHLVDRLTSAGYEHYELSNFARPGYRSRHNSSYWHDVPYTGIGAAAHSYDGQRRWWNVSDLFSYMQRVESGASPIDDSECITGWTRYNDRITVALRTREGLDLLTLTAQQRDYCLQSARRFLADGLLCLHNQRHLALTRRGLFVSDMVMSELMRV